MRRNSSIFKVTDAFENKDKWKENHLLIRKEAYDRGVRFPVVLAEVKSGTAYIFEGAKTPIHKPFNPISAA